MAVAFVPWESLARKARWRFVRPIRRRAIPGGQVLLLHPPSGSWAILPQEKMPEFIGLVQAVELGLMDDRQPAHEPLLGRLFESGLLERDGRTAFTEARFVHTGGPLQTLLLKLVGYCNLACAYCYDFDPDTYHHKLPIEVAERAIDEALDLAGEQLTLLYHGGEPLLAFPELVHLTEYARRAAAQRGKTVGFSLQTNGTRFTRETVDFLLREKIGVGISLDGPAELNDRWRVDHAGQGSHESIEQALRDFPELVPKIGVLTTITRANVEHLIDVAHYVRDLGVRQWDATMFDAGGRGATGPEDYAPDDNELIAAHLKLLDAVEQGEFDDLAVRPVLRYLRNVLSYRRESFCLRNGCGAAADLVSVAADGTVRSCDCIKDRTLDLGHIRAGGLAASLSSDRAASIRARSADSLTQCRDCDWRVFCGGTCLARASLDSVDPVTCSLSLALFPEIFRRLAASDRLIRYAERHE